MTVMVSKLDLISKSLLHFYKKGTIASKINVTLYGLRLSEKLQLIATLCNEIWLQ